VGSIPIARFPTSSPADEVAEEQLKEISRREFEQIFSQGRLDLIDETVAADYVCYDPALPDTLRGPQGLKQAVRGFRAAFPDLTFVVEEQIAEGDTVVTRWTARGTHLGELFGLAPTGARVTMPGIDSERFVDGKIVECYANWDTLGLLRQLGAVDGGP
jgi:steroid delta-isomerase-like uncharacterized protein